MAIESMSEAGLEHKHEATAADSRSEMNKTRRTREKREAAYVRG